MKHYFQNFPQGDDSDDPLDFWIKSEKHYSKLASVTMDLLCIQASTTPVERIFSTAGYGCSGQYNRLTDTNLKREVMFSKNKKYIDA